MSVVKNWRAWLRTVASVLMGYLVIVICTSAGFAPLGGIIHIDAPLKIHILGGLVALGAGAMGGFVAAAIAPSRPIRHATAVLLFLIIDTAVVLTRPSSDPRWFELAGSTTLMISTIAGAALWVALHRRAHLRHSQRP
jgi:hypothetical protein